MTLSLEDKYREVKNQVLFDIESTYTQIMKNKELKALYQTGIIPQAQQSLNSALTGYQVDKVDFITLLNNQMTLFNYEL